MFFEVFLFYLFPYFTGTYSVRGNGEQNRGVQFDPELGEE